MHHIKILFGEVRHEEEEKDKMPLFLDCKIFAPTIEVVNGLSIIKLLESWFVDIDGTVLPPVISDWTFQTEFHFHYMHKNIHTYTPTPSKLPICLDKWERKPINGDK